MQVKRKLIVPALTLSHLPSLVPCIGTDLTTFSAPCFQHPSALLGIDSLKSIPWSYLPYSAKCSLHKCSLTVSLAFTWSEGVLVNTVVRGGWNVIFFLLGLVLNNHSPLSMDLSEIPTRNTWSKSKTLLTVQLSFVFAKIAGNNFHHFWDKVEKAPDQLNSLGFRCFCQEVRYQSRQVVAVPQRGKQKVGLKIENNNNNMQLWL